MPFSRITIILNPISGGPTQRRQKRRLISYIHRLHRTLDHQPSDTLSLTLTRHPKHAMQIARSEAASGTERILVCGGDGTVNEAAQGLIHTYTTLAIIPTGSGNGLARHLDIPSHWRLAADLALAHEPLSIDHGLIDNHPFFATAGVGLDAEVGWAFARLSNRGLKSYLQATAQLYLNYKPHTYRITIDGKPRQVEALMLTFANASQFGNDAIIAPDARTNDGLLHLVIVRPFPKVAIGILAAMLFHGSIHQSSFVETIPFTHLHLQTDTPMRGHVDGEPISRPNQLEVSVVPSSLRVVAGPHAPERTGLSPRPMHPRRTARRSMQHLARIIEQERRLFPLRHPSDSH